MIVVFRRMWLNSEHRRQRSQSHTNGLQCQRSNSRRAFICSIWHTESIWNGGGANHDDSTTLRPKEKHTFSLAVVWCQILTIFSIANAVVAVASGFSTKCKRLPSMGFRRKSMDFSTSETLTFKPVNFLFMWSWHLVRCLCLKRAVAPPINN